MPSSAQLMGLKSCPWVSFFFSFNMHIYIYTVYIYIPTGSLKTVGQNDILFFSLTSVRPLFVELLAMSRET